MHAMKFLFHLISYELLLKTYMFGHWDHGTLQLFG